MSALFDLTGRTALITGAGRGLGLAYAEGLAEAGAAVVINDLNDENLVEAILALRAKSYEARALAFDVTDEVAVAAAFSALDQEGVDVDILINNAGIQFRKPLVDLDLKDWQRVIDTNLTSAFIVGKQAAIRMIARGRGGKIINVGSVNSQAARPTIAPYTTAKGGLVMLSRSMAAEWAQHGIQVKTVAPGYILTEMTQRLADEPEFDAWVKSSNPARRWGKPEDLIGTAVYLASSASNYVNGQVIFVDGGWLSVL
jgi:gluconate 5-dehydrogenase